MNQKKKRVLAVVSGCAVIAIVSTSLMGATFAGRGAAVEEEEAVRQTVVETVTPTIGDIVVVGEFIGTVDPNQQVTVYPKAAGEVLEVYFNVGDTVQAGDALLQIDSTTLQNTIAQTQATISNAQAKANLSLEMATREYENYGYNINEGYNSNLLQAEAAVRSAENGLEIANNAWRAARNAYNEARGGETSEYFSDAEVDALRTQKVQAELSVETAQLGLEQAKANLEALKVQLNQGDDSVADNVTLARLNADFSDQYIALQQLQNNLADYTVKAPISGVIEQRNVDPYDMASGQAPVFVISNKDAMTISFNVAEASLSSMRSGDRVTIEKNGQTATGTITEITTMANAVSGLYTVKATVQNVPFDLYSGSTVKLYVETQKAQNELMLPIDAVYYDNGVPYVYVMENGIAKRVEIETGIADIEHIQVVYGLSLMDQVIITWSSGLYDGSQVILAGAEPAASSEEQEESADAEDADTADTDAEDAAAAEETADGGAGGEEADEASSGDGQNEDTLQEQDADEGDEEAGQ